MAADGYPVADQAAGKALGAALRRAGYDEDAVFRLLGDDAYAGDAEDAPVHDRRLPQTRVATLVRAFFVGLPVPEAELVRALGERGAAALQATGLARIRRGTVVPRARISPIADLLIASDGWSRDEDDPPDYVATYTPTARMLDSLTPRVRVGRALDVGTGNGIHALLAARHSRSVVATDVNRRALAYAELNAALNGIDNLECRRGSLFEPVEGERFDLITCNAPYVVSPESRWTYRDSGFDADEVSARVVSGAAEHLADDGFATMLVSWVAREAAEPNGRVLAWAHETGCDAWIMSLYGSDPLDHAASWNSHLTGDPKSFGAALDEWNAYLEGLSIGWVSEGAVVLHRRQGGRATTRIDVVEDEELEVASAQLRRAFAARARLAELGRASDLLDLRLAPVDAVRVEQELVPRAGGAVVEAVHVRLDEGTHPSVDASARAAEVVGALGGEAILRETIGAVARRLELTDSQAGRLRREALELCSELLELGALRIV
ncbi:MAG: hypothetical protein QOE36_3420 [Gaiellaceae bacterium]|nr:hypothetical protein [Gaiellaceae bacterium]